MKAIFTYSLLLLLIGLYVISSSEKLTRFLAQHRFYSNSLLASDRNRFGDLYGRSFLPGFKDPQANQVLHVPPAVYSLKGKKVINLYAIHDSYLMRDIYLGKPDTLIQGINNYIDIKWWKNLEGGIESSATVNIDSSMLNILLIEITERDLIRALSDTALIYTRLKTVNYAANENISYSAGNGWWFKPYSLPNPSIEENLKFNVFDYHFLAPLKELSAVLNEKLLDQTVDNDVAISSDHKYLYWAKTLDKNEGSFSLLSDSEVNSIVNTLNCIYQHYRALGFDEVYFSPIPNPVSILHTEPQTYNGLLPRIENNAGLRMKIIDAYLVLQNSRYYSFTQGESHWTRDGYQLWLNEVNRVFSDSCVHLHNK